MVCAFWVRGVFAKWWGFCWIQGVWTTQDPKTTQSRALNCTTQPHAAPHSPLMAFYNHLSEESDPHLARTGWTGAGPKHPSECTRGKRKHGEISGQNSREKKWYFSVFLKNDSRKHNFLQGLLTIRSFLKISLFENAVFLQGLRASEKSEKKTLFENAVFYMVFAHFKKV